VRLSHNEELQINEEEIRGHSHAGFTRRNY